jgi:hypothetical protein
MKVHASIAVVALLLSSITWASAARAEPGDEFTISVLTFGPGDHPFSKFGHDGLLVEDAKRGTSRVYNYGTYSFQSAWLIPKFLMGKYRYWLSVSPLFAVVPLYARENRSVTAQRLALTAAQKQKLVTHLEWNARDENKYYVFDYYRDNCATRLRDLVDAATDGALHAATEIPASLTWRGHTQRLAADDWFVYLGLDLAMGGFIDQPITFWQEMFLPAKLYEGLQRVRIPGPEGSSVPLVDKETVLFADSRAPLRTEPPSRTLPLLGAGSAAALLAALLGWGAQSSRAARAALGVLTSLLGLILGFLGCLFALLWAITNHEVAYRNENLLQCAPFALLLVGYGVRLALGHAASTWRAHRIARLGLACSALGLALKVLPWFAQKNGHLIAFFLPLWAGLAAATWLASGGDVGRGTDSDRLLKT